MAKRVVIRAGLLLGAGVVAAVMAGCSTKASHSATTVIADSRSMGGDAGSPTLDSSDAVGDAVDGVGGAGQQTDVTVNIDTVTQDVGPGPEPETLGVTCLLPADTQLCSNDETPGGTSFVPRSLRALPGGRLHVSGLRGNGLWGQPTTGQSDCQCRSMERNTAPGGFWYGDFDPDAGVFTTVGVCPIPQVDSFALIDELNVREFIFDWVSPTFGPAGQPIPPALVVAVGGATWRANLFSVLQGKVLERILTRDKPGSFPGFDVDLFGMPVAACLYSTEVLEASGCFPNPETGAYANIPDNADSHVELELGGVPYHTAAAPDGHNLYTFFARLPGEETLALRTWAVSTESGIGGSLVFALDVPLAGVGSWSSMDTPAPTLVMGSGTGKPCCGAGLWSAGNGCWLEVEVSKAGDRVVGTFQGRVGPGGCSENIGGDVNGAFDIGYSPCPWQ